MKYAIKTKVVYEAQNKAQKSRRKLKEVLRDRVYLYAMSETITNVIVSIYVPLFASLGHSAAVTAIRHIPL